MYTWTPPDDPGSVSALTNRSTDFAAFLLHAIPFFLAQFPPDEFSKANSLKGSRS